MPESGDQGWIGVLTAIPLPVVLLVAGVIWALIELRVRKMLDARDAAWKKSAARIQEEVKEDLRREFTGPIANVGVDAMRALELARGHEPRIVELETKTGVFWRMIERSTANLLRQPGED